MIRANPRLGFRTFGKRYIFFGPTDYFLEVGRGESQSRWTLSEAEFEKVLSEQSKKPVYIGYTGVPTKHYWWYKDEILVCDEKFDAKILKGWRVKRDELKSKRLQKYKDLGAPTTKRKAARPRSKAPDQRSVDAAKALLQLGYKKKETSSLVEQILNQAPKLTTEGIVKEALKLLKQ